ncbi:MAG: D-2-hydroxyacid dehydrogenase family protein [Beijerinckiaceae bacterium]
MRMKVAVLDDSQDVAPASANWNALRALADVVFFRDPLGSEEDIARSLRDVHIILAMRERTAFSASLLAKLPALKMIALTGQRAPTLDLAACTQRGILVCNTGGDFVPAATPELAWGLVLACARAIPQADAVMKKGGWHGGVPLGVSLAGKRLGILGLGKLGSKVASYGKAFGMDVVAWSHNLTAEDAQAKGVTRVDKQELFAASDVISLHLVLGDRSRGIVGAGELTAMKDGAILVNTSRGPLIDNAALIAELQKGRITVGLDVFDTEPLQPDHPLRTFSNAVLTPHLGYSTIPVFRQFYGESVENIVAWLQGAPIRMMNPEVWKAA